MSAARKTEIVEEKEVEVEVANDSGEQVEKKTPIPQKHVITLEDSVPDVISWDQAGDTLVFDHRSYLELPEDVVKDLKYENRNNYFLARGMRMAADSAPIRKKRKLIDPFSNIILRRVKDIKRRYRDEDGQEWHQAWIDPKNVDAMKGLGYRTVRDPERNESKVIRNGDTVELVCMEVRWPMYADHLQAMSEKSQAAYTQNVKELEQRVKRNYGLTLLDENDPEQADYLNWLERKMQRVGG